jgi:hypothetical protein
LEKEPKKKSPCPKCGTMLFRRAGRITTQEQMDSAHNAARARQTESVLKECAEWDNDLVQVSTHSNPCEICAPFDGKIFSITGKTPGFPLLKEKPPFCKGCRHSLNPTSLNALKWRNIYK